jgi:hypothetical protein
MPLPFGLDSPTSSLPFGAATADIADPEFPDRVAVYPLVETRDEDGAPAREFGDPVEFDAAVFWNKFGTGRRVESADTTFGVGRCLVNFRPGARPPIDSPDGKILVLRAGAESLDPRPILIPLEEAAPPTGGKAWWSVLCERSGSEPAAPADATPGEATTTEGAVVIADGGSRDTDLSVAADSYVLTDGTTLAYTPDGTPTTLPIDGVFYLWLDRNGNIQATP